MEKVMGENMQKWFEELAYAKTAMGDLILRKRTVTNQNEPIFEVKLGEEFLMSSLFTKSEVALATLGLRELNIEEIDVAVGGLGLGYTARAVLADQRVRTLLVVDALQEVIDWHLNGLVPDSRTMTDDARCHFLHGDFFATFGVPLREASRDVCPRKFHAILVDIDHSPRALLSESHAPFYEVAGLKSVASHLHPGGVFGLWSNDPPDHDFVAKLQTAFEYATAHVVTFENPLQGRDAASTIYVARARSDLPQIHRATM